MIRSKSLWRLAVGLAPVLVLFSGCRPEAVSVYSVPKEPAAVPNQVASPHGEGSASPHGSMAATPEVKYALPSGWVDQGAAGMNLASFSASTDAGGVEVSVLALPVAAGREMGINVLRSSAGMAGVDSAGLEALAEPATIAGQAAQLYDMPSEASAAKPVRLLLGVVTQDSLIWYVRMTGAPEAVEAQKPVLLDFMKSLSLAAPTAMAMASAPVTTGAAAASEAQGLPSWEVPGSWQAQAAPNMVLAKFTAGPAGQEAEIAVSVFPGDVGGAAANVNRWRAQVGLTPALPDSEALALLSPVALGDGEGQLIDIEGQRGGQPVRMIGAIVPRGGQTWFYKLTGPPSSAQAQKEAFLQFLKTVRHPQP